MYLNKAILIGNLTRDPELKSLPSGIKVCTFALATNRVWKDANGVKQEDVEFHNIVVFGKRAENVAQYMKKGNSLLVEGRIQTRSWEDKTSGEKKYRTEIVADSIQFGSKSEAPKTQEVREPNTNIHVPMVEGVEYPEDDINLDEIPF